MTNAKLLLSAILGLTPHMDMLDEYSKAQTSANPKRYKRTSEVENEKKRAQRREIAEWNAGLEALKK